MLSSQGAEKLDFCSVESIGPRHTLGSVSSWSPALRTMVGMVLKNGSPLVLWWGPELVQIYNDAFRSIPATKHPSFSGRSRQPNAGRRSGAWSDQ